VTAEHTPGYIAALAAALHQANVNALVAAENGNNQLGIPVPHHPGLRVWNGDLLRVGHHDEDTHCLEVNALLPDGKYVDMAHHKHVHINPDLRQWVFCAKDADGSVPITIAVTQTRQPDDPEPIT
jgi:hypothetical protein